MAIERFVIKVRLGVKFTSRNILSNPLALSFGFFSVKLNIALHNISAKFKCHNSVNCDRPGECIPEKDCLR